MEYLEKRMGDLKEKEKELREGKTDKELAERFENAIAVIEEIAVNQEELPRHLNTETEKRLHKAVTLIYRIAHTARLPGCFEKHMNWEEEFQELKEKFGV